MDRPLQARHGVVCRLPGARFGYFGWPTVARMEDGTLFTVCYQKAAAGEKCSLLWSAWRLSDA
jgi:hypothetical protein